MSFWHEFALLFCVVGGGMLIAGAIKIFSLLGLFDPSPRYDQRDDTDRPPYH